MQGKKIKENKENEVERMRQIEGNFDKSKTRSRRVKQRRERGENNVMGLKNVDKGE